MTLNANISAHHVPPDAAGGLQLGKVRVVTLTAGSRLFRGGSTERPSGVPVPKKYWAAAPWWIREDEYRKIVDAHLERQGEFRGSLGYLMREAMAVKQGWSRVDVRVKAEVLQDIQAFEAAGQTQFEVLPNGMKVVWRGWRGFAKQLYIPNLNKDRSSEIVVYFDGQPALRVLTKKIIDSEQVFGRGGT